MIELMVQLGIPVILLILGYLFGRVIEKRHFRSLIERELASQDLPVVASRFPPEDQYYEQRLVSGSVVIAADYFKTFLAVLINLFGGRVTPFESLLDRARRESILRMKHQATQLQAAYVFNVKFDTAGISTGASRGAATEVLAYGTALIPSSERSSTASASVHAAIRQRQSPGGARPGQE